MEWNDLMQGFPFISDLGGDQEITMDGKSVTLGRYAVWQPLEGGGRHQIAEVGNDLDALREKYNVPGERVCALAN